MRPEEPVEPWKTATSATGHVRIAFGEKHGHGPLPWKNLLGADLERLFDLAELMQLGRWVLGVEPDEVGGHGARGSFAAALAKRCAAEDATAALCDAVLALRQGTDPAIARLRDGGAEGRLLEAGDKLGPYTIERSLGQGALGAVYVARRR